MTIGELVKWCDENGIGANVEVAIETGIDVWVDLSHAVYDGTTLLLLGGMEDE